MCRVFCYIAYMNKAADIALGFIPTIIILSLLAMLINPYDHIYYFILTSQFICLTTGIIMIRKEGYKYIGTGVISALISFYLFLLLSYIALSGPM